MGKHGVWMVGLVWGAVAAEPTLLDAPLPIAFDAGNPPAMWGEGGTVKGIQPTLIAEAARSSGVAVAMTALPWPRALAALDAGESCVGGAYSTPERKARYQLSDTIWTERIVAVGRANEGRPAVQRLDDLRGQRIGLHRGWSYGAVLDAGLSAEGVQTLRFTYADRLFMALAAGKVDVALTDGDGAAAVPKSLGLPLQVLGTLSHNTTHVICPAGERFARALRRLNTGLQRLHEQGRASALVEQVRRKGALPQGVAP